MTSSEQTDKPTPGPSLLDIEDQKRRELLARKAVMASRRIKMQSSTETSLSRDHLESSLAPTIAVEQVDHFLNTISSDYSDSQPSNGIDAPVSDPKLMDVDTPISHSSGSETPTVHADVSMEIDVSSFTRIERPSSSLARRNSKRPVASDFVEISAAQTTTNSGFVSNDRYPAVPRTTSSGLSTPVIRARPNFSTVGAARTCIIDISDDEEDEYTNIPIREADAVRAKEEEIRKLRAKIEKYRFKKTTEVRQSTKRDIIRN